MSLLMISFTLLNSPLLLLKVYSVFSVNSE